jgi:hypothetical protein
MKQTKGTTKLMLQKQTVSVLKEKEMTYVKGGVTFPTYCGTNQGCNSNFTACGGSCFSECPTSLPSSGAQVEA